MVRFLLTLLCLTLVLGLFGCQEQEKPQKKPIWEDTKISDLAPANSSRVTPIREATFEVYVVEIPAGDSKTIGNIKGLLYDNPININNREAFVKNNFAVGFNQTRVMGKLNEILSKTTSRRLRAVTILIPANQENQIYAKKIFKKQNIYYNSEADTTEAITAGPGDIILELKVEVVETQRGICKLYAQPVFMPPLINTIAEFAEHQDNKKCDFSAVGFNVAMSPGDLIVLTPIEYIKHQGSLGSLFFCNNKPIGVQKIYIIICSRVNF